jgi:Glutamine cyclotransferase
MWPTGFIYRIDVSTGTVLGRIDARGLLEDDVAANADILNGIAFDSNTGHLLLTGKFWPTVFEVELPPSSEARETSGACSMLTAPESASRTIQLAVPWLLLIERRRRAGRPG